MASENTTHETNKKTGRDDAIAGKPVPLPAFHPETPQYASYMQGFRTDVTTRLR